MTHRVTASPYGAFLRTRTSHLFSVDEKCTARGMAPQVRSRLNFNSQSSPLPHALAQYTHYTTAHSGQGSTMGRVLEGSDKCHVHGKVVQFSEEESGNRQPDLQHLLFLIVLWGLYPKQKLFPDKTD